MLPTTTPVPIMETLLEDLKNNRVDSKWTNISSSNKDSNGEIFVTKYVSDKALCIILIVVMVTLSGSISLLGISSNVINIIVFIRQGILSESCNVSLLGLSVADLFCVLSMLWTSVTYVLALHKPPNISWEPFDVLYISGAWPRVIFGLIARLITTLVAVERCVCVVFPFKVKYIFTPKSSGIIVISIFIYSFITYSPVYYYNQLRYAVNMETNITRLRLVTLAGFTHYEAVVSYINLLSLNFGTVAVVLISTMITVSRVKMSRAWRESYSTSGNETANAKFEKTKHPMSDNEGAKSQSTKIELKPEDGSEKSDGGNGMQTTHGKSNQMSVSRMRKEKRLISMITFISVIFLLSYIPNLTILFMYGIDDEINTKGDYQNLAWAMFSFIFLSETINSSINILVYFKMSSKFKQECQRLLGIKT